MTEGAKQQMKKCYGLTFFIVISAPHNVYSKYYHSHFRDNKQEFRG